MTRDARKRWLTRITLVALTGLIGLGVWLRWGTPPRPADAPGPDDTAIPAWLLHETVPPVFHKTGPLGPPGTDASLVVAENFSARPEHRIRVVRYDFKNGRVQPPETLWEGSYRDFFGAEALIENRYLVCSWGGVIDLQEKTLIHKGVGRLIDVLDDRVVSGVYKDAFDLERPVSFNLRTRTIEKLTECEVNEFEQRGSSGFWRGIRSPDRMKSVEAWSYSLTLNHVGQPPKEWGRFNRTGLHRAGLWLDNERFLTQDDYGNLLTVGLDGVRVPVMEIPVAEKNLTWHLFAPDGFERDADGRIIYTCGRECFFINTEAKTWERCEWKSLGHGFEQGCFRDDQGRSVYRYKGTEILRAPDWTHVLETPEALTTEGYIAVWAGRRVRVWFAGTGEWTTLGENTRFLAGWIK